MTFLARIGLAVWFASTLIAYAPARAEAPPTLATELTAFASDEGIARLARSAAKADFPTLANQFEAQSNAAFCGPTTAAIVLNAIHSGSRDLPRDRSRLREEDFKYTPSGFDLTLPRFTQDNVIARGAKTRAQILGEPVNIGGKQIQDYGYQTRQLDELFRAHGLHTRLVIVDERQSDEEIRAELVENLRRRGDYVVVTYSRKAVGQEGGGHISPLAAYDAESDSFLVLDVNPARAGWLWIPTATLIRGMRTFDTVENRGYILIQ